MLILRCDYQTEKHNQITASVKIIYEIISNYEMYSNCLKLLNVINFRYGLLLSCYGTIVAEQLFKNTTEKCLKLSTQFHLICTALYLSRNSVSPLIPFYREF